MKLVVYSMGMLVTLGGLVAIAGCGNSTTSAGTGGHGGTSSSHAGSGGASGGTHVIGDACTATSDCQAGDFCSTTDPGGQCLKTCTKAADCPTGSSCTSEMKCYKTCAGASDCTRTGYACVDAMSVDAKAIKTCDIAPVADAGDGG